MSRPCFFPLLIVLCSLPGALADTIQLKDKAAVVGKVLAEKHDQVVVDVGYTVLVIPRNQIVKILEDRGSGARGQTRGQSQGSGGR